MAKVEPAVASVQPVPALTPPMPIPPMQIVSAELQTTPPEPTRVFGMTVPPSVVSWRSWPVATSCTQRFQSQMKTALVPSGDIEGGGAPVVPVRIDGLQHVMGVGYHMARPGRVRVAFGAPLRLVGEDYEALAKTVEAAVRALQ